MKCVVCDSSIDSRGLICMPKNRCDAYVFSSVSIVTALPSFTTLLSGTTYISKHKIFCSWIVHSIFLPYLHVWVSRCIRFSLVSILLVCNNILTAFAFVSLECLVLCEFLMSTWTIHTVRNDIQQWCMWRGFSTITTSCYGLYGVERFDEVNWS